MQHETQHYVNGAWVEPLEPVLLDVIVSTGARRKARQMAGIVEFLPSLCAVPPCGF